MRAALEIDAHGTGTSVNEAEAGALNFSHNDTFFFSIVVALCSCTPTRYFHLQPKDIPNELKIIVYTILIHKQQVKERNQSCVLHRSRKFASVVRKAAMMMTTKKNQSTTKPAFGRRLLLRLLRFAPTPKLPLPPVNLPYRRPPSIILLLVMILVVLFPL